MKSDNLFKCHYKNFSNQKISMVLEKIKSQIVHFWGFSNTINFREKAEKIIKPASAKTSWARLEEVPIADRMRLDFCTSLTMCLTLGAGLMIAPPSVQSQPLAQGTYETTPQQGNNTFNSPLPPQAAPHPAPSQASEMINSFEANSDVEAQVKGDYPAMERPESLPLGAIQHAWDRAGESDGVYTVNYSPRKVIRLRVREFMTTSVILPPWEKIDQIVCGDKSAFGVREIPNKPNIILIEPGAFIGTDTTITVFGRSSNVYVFYVRGEGYNSKSISDIAVYVRAPQVHQTASGQLYKASNKELSEASQKDRIQHTQGSSSLSPIALHKEAASIDSPTPDYLEEVSFDPNKLNFDFTMAGNPEIAPERVYSDGIRTWFDYGERIKTTNLPTISNVVDGIDTPVNVVREGSKLIAYAAGSFTLRNGQKVTCVYPTDAKSGKE